ncbi:YqaE/Pmp3 family membrane protein [Ralstonia pseudosolanacearum]|uniref:YqaE/Pmp3 family membrane protein n=1 Tax=Ralstonia pseudosolanacearum TaxID=1310165 RepID=UPI001FF72A75|nr:YqaE/Pmp3 family membrane protein [Ralstonia pseudosolanacearum]
MRIITSLFAPWLHFLTVNRPVAAIVCLLLQISLIGWAPATIWSAYSINQYNKAAKRTAMRIDMAIAEAAMRHSQLKVGAGL